MASTSSPPPYEYEPLAKPRDIRLLKISARNASFSIEHVDLDSPPPYVAISYVWGDATADRSLSIGDRTLAITTSLATAIADVLRSVVLAMRSEWEISKNLESSALYLWADAICINQTDIAEKNRQVPLMTEIYSSAAFVATHLGPCNEDLQTGWDLLFGLQKWHGMRVAAGGDRALPWDYDLEELGLPPAASSAWAALRSILHARWSQRAWIVQEFVVNPNLVLVCGHITLVEWRIFYQMHQLVQMGELPAECLITTHQRTNQPLPGQTLTDKSSNMYSLTSLRLWYRKNDQRLNKTLLQVLMTGQVFEASDVRDKVFAFLNLANDQANLRIQPDYSPANSAGAVFTSTTVKLIESSGLLDVFNSVNIEKRLTGLPSWVPDWSGRPSGLGRHLLHLTELIKAKIYIAAGETRAHSVVNHATQELQLQGTIVDHIGFLITCAEGAQGEVIDINLSRTLQILQAYYAALERTATTTTLPPAYRTEALRKTAFWRTLIANTSYRDDEATDDDAVAFDALLAMHDRTDGQAPITRADDASTQNLARNFKVTLATFLSGRCLAVTRLGYFCLVQVGVKPGDAIAVLRGGRTPFVLRAVSADSDGAAAGSKAAGDTRENKYRLLADSYVHGLMKGEALQWSELDEDICLI